MQRYLRRYLVSKSHVGAKISEAEILALQVIYGKDEQAIASWQHFRNAGFDIDSLYLSSGKDILPALCERLSNLVPEDPWLGKMKGFSRYTWTRNQFLLNTLKTIVTSFREHDIKCAVFGDAAMLLSYYRALSIRPIQNLALMVNPPDFERAVKLADQHELPTELIPNWSPGYRPVRVCKSMHEIKLEDANDKLLSVQFADFDFPILDPPNLLLILLIDVYYFDINQARWFIDIARILSAFNSDREIDYVMQKIESLQMSAPLIQVWSFFRETARSVYFEVESSKIVTRLDAISVRMDELAKRAIKRISVGGV